MLNDQLATMTFHPSPAVLWCSGYGTGGMPGKAIAVNPVSARQRERPVDLAHETRAVALWASKRERRCDTRVHPGFRAS